MRGVLLRSTGKSRCRPQGGREVILARQFLKSLWIKVAIGELDTASGISIAARQI